MFKAEITPNVAAVEETPPNDKPHAPNSKAGEPSRTHCPVVLDLSANAGNDVGCGAVATTGAARPLRGKFGHTASHQLDDLEVISVGVVPGHSLASQKS